MSTLHIMGKKKYILVLMFDNIFVKILKVIRRKKKEKKIGLL